MSECLHNTLNRSGLLNPVWFCAQCDENILPVADLERAVVEAAVKARLCYNEYGNAVASPLAHTEQEHMSITVRADIARKELFAAVDALIAVRDKLKT